MSNIVRRQAGTLANFDPEKSKEKISVLSAAIKHAQEMKEWDAGWDAVDWMIEEQKLFVAWWRATVRKRGTVGRGRKLERADQRDLMSESAAEAKTKIKHQTVSKWDSLIKQSTYRARLFRPSYKQAMRDREDTRSELQTGEMEWFTPAIYVEKARAVLGRIDLDPASCKEAQETIKAARFHSTTDDGLTQNWAGTVWLNPPYAGRLVAAFAKKMVASWNADELEAAVMLTNAYTETSWFHALTNASQAVCFTRGRIKFESPHGEKCAPTNGQSFFYFGKNLDLFYRNFADVGLVMAKVETS